MQATLKALHLCNVIEKTEAIKKGNRKTSHCKLVTEGDVVPKQEDVNEISLFNMLRVRVLLNLNII